MGVKSTKKPTGSSGSGPHLRKVKGENFYRDSKAAKRAKILTGGKAVRDKTGKIIQSAVFQKTEAETEPGRVQPDKRWFGNTRVISQDALAHFRTALSDRAKDPFSVVLRRAKLPMSLLATDSNPGTAQRPKIVEVEPFSDTFGPKAQRKRARLEVGSFADLAAAASGTGAEPVEGEGELDGEGAALPEAEEAEEEDGYKDAPAHPLFAKGTSKRIHGELHKVIDSSDVLVHVLDARDPSGTMCEAVMDFVKKERAHKQLIFIMNKCDLVPSWVAARWLAHLSKIAPTLAFHASMHHSFGKGSLIQLLRQFQNLHADRKQISVGFIGYPNVGKSSIINCLKKNKVCTVAPIPGETKVWQYITLTKKIYLIDCPGIVPISKNDSETDTVLKGVIRLSALPNPSEYIPELLGRVRPEYLGRTYGVDATWTWGENGEKEGLPVDIEASEHWLEKMARKTGKLLKHGEPDRDTVARMVMGDWQRGKLPYYTKPPMDAKDVEKEKERQEQRVKAKADKKEKKLLGVQQDIRVLKFPTSTKWLDVDEMGDGQELPAVVGVEGSEIIDEDDDDEDDDADEEVDAVEDDEVVDDEDDDEGEADEEEAAEPELTWEEAIGTVIGPTGQLREPAPSSSPSKSRKRAAPPADDEDDDSEDSRPKKAPRMTTNKKKAVNFFATANVKNKNRNKKMPKPGEENGRGRRRR
ncbi:NGP1NT-domain-containing protein [Calocera viscosa TUFC12733]|uniref:Nucleolar GTP-binding protein 2 n=1 Tax=Calocera viscosa (strain TUFC12733) TaxID=1330018 RepID=A0A167HSK9_CALVF|nr:NGP1NT-domain-containing protein [Calocera viscosa TUFC12733]